MTLTPVENALFIISAVFFGATMAAFVGFPPVIPIPISATIMSVSALSFLILRAMKSRGGGGAETRK